MRDIALLLALEVVDMDQFKGHTQKVQSSQDLAAAHAIWEQAEHENVGQNFELLD